jgi:NAD(P)-dependent dehydrogenase (short-subunit alcohol dehydrogenase family)
MIELGMHNKIAIVTGSEGDIGFEICNVLKKDGFDLIGIDIVDPVNRGDYLSYVQGSVSSIQLIDQIFQDLREWNPRDIALVNNAGVTFPDDTSLKSWNLTLEVNLTAPFLWMERMANYFEEHRIHGSIVSITSLAAEFSFPGNPSYAAAKGGLRQLTKSYSQRLGKIGIPCNNLAPGYVETKFNAKSLAAKNKYENRARHSVMKRWGKPAEIAACVSFLCSDKAKFITGQDIFVDGGWSSQGLVEYD